MERGLSVAAIAAEAGVSDTTWTKYEHGGDVNQMSAVKIERALGGEAAQPTIAEVAAAVDENNRLYRELLAEVRRLRHGSPTGPE